MTVKVPHYLQDRDDDAYHILHNRCPSYLVDLQSVVTFNTTDSHRHQLRSSQTTAAVMKRTRRTQFGKRVFSAYGPNMWNSLPPAVRNIDSHSFSVQTSSEVTFILLLFYCVTFTPVL